MLKGTLRVVLIATLGFAVTTGVIATEKKKPKSRGAAEKEINAAAAALRQVQAKFPFLDSATGWAAVEASELNASGWTPRSASQQIFFDNATADALTAFQSSLSELSNAVSDNTQAISDENAATAGIATNSMAVSKMWDQLDNLSGKLTSDSTATSRADQLASRDAARINSNLYEIQQNRQLSDVALNQANRDAWVIDNHQNEIAYEESQINSNRGLAEAGLGQAEQNARSVDAEEQQINSNRAIAVAGLNEANQNANNISAEEQQINSNRELAFAGYRLAYWNLGQISQDMSRISQEQMTINNLSMAEARFAMNQTLIDNNLQGQLFRNDVNIAEDRQAIEQNFIDSLHNYFAEQKNARTIGADQMRDLAAIALNKAGISKLNTEQVIDTLRQRTEQIGIDKLNNHLAKFQAGIRQVLRQAEQTSLDDAGLKQEAVGKLKQTLSALTSARVNLDKGYTKAYKARLAAANNALNGYLKLIKTAGKAKELSPAQLQGLKRAHAFAAEYTRQVGESYQSGGKDARGAAALSSQAEYAIKAQKRNLEYYNTGK